jgi:hypothetical protein
MDEYIKKRMGVSDLRNELSSLIKQYKKHRNSYLFIYCACIAKRIPDASMRQDDYYVFHDLLANKDDVRSVDIYIETPGGSAETAEDIVTFLRERFEKVSFIVSGEAKSAGTLMVLSGDEILMTETGSLGPIDAQVSIGRYVTSAYDYNEWVEQKRQEAKKKGALNPFDATMIAQITPGELSGVFHALEYAKDLAKKWLVDYKFRTWKTTETQKKPVTSDMKKKRADEIARELANHRRWRSHGRSIKIDALREELKLKITKVDDDPVLRDIVYKIQVVCRLLFSTSNIYKIFATKDNSIYKQATGGVVPRTPPMAKKPDVVEVSVTCEKCGRKHKLYAKFKVDPQIDADFDKKGFTKFPRDGKLKCGCGFEINLSGVRNQLEMQVGKRMVV